MEKIGSSNSYRAKIYSDGPPFPTTPDILLKGISIHGSVTVPVTQVEKGSPLGQKDLLFRKIQHMVSWMGLSTNTN